MRASCSSSRCTGPEGGDHARACAGDRGSALPHLSRACRSTQILMMLLSSGRVSSTRSPTPSPRCRRGASRPTATSIAHFSPALQIVVLVFMICAAGVNFALYLALLRAARAPSVLPGSSSCASYLGSSRSSRSSSWSPSISRWTRRASSGAASALLDAGFQVASLLTTTGFATEDFAEWPGMAHAVLVALMFVGGCAGSTAGGAEGDPLAHRGRGGHVARGAPGRSAPTRWCPMAVGDQVVPEASGRGVGGR